MQKQERTFFISTINLSNIVWLHENRKLTQNINKQILKPPSDDIYICGNKWSMAFVSATSLSNILRLKKMHFYNHSFSLPISLICKAIPSTLGKDLQVLEFSHAPPTFNWWPYDTMDLQAEDEPIEPRCWLLQLFSKAFSLPYIGLWEKGAYRKTKQNKTKKAFNHWQKVISLNKLNKNAHKKWIRGRHITHSLRCQHLMRMTCFTPLLPIKLAANVHVSTQQLMADIPEDLLPILETQMELPGPNFYVAWDWLL